MLTYMLAIVLNLQAAQPRCETYAPRLDGSVVTVCDGHVARVQGGTTVTVAGKVR